MGTRTTAIMLGIALSAVAVVTGLQALQRGPATAASRDDDLQRASALQELAGVISRHYEETGALPASLAELVNSGRMVQLPADPATQQSYVFEPEEADDSYTLCASFDTASAEGEVAEFWMHGAGRSCFRLSPAYGEY
ncbi:MAG: hypothetical protein ACO3PV_06330 [Pseudohongiellaceae bacterium]